MLDTTWKRLVSTNVEKNHFAFYEIGIEKVQGRYFAVQKHGRIGGRYPRDDGFCGLKVPRDSSGHESLDEAMEVVERFYARTLKSKTRTYRRLNSLEELVEYDCRVQLMIKDIPKMASFL